MDAPCSGRGRGPAAPLLSFPDLTGLGVAGGLTLRVPGVDVRGEKPEVMARLDSAIRAAAAELAPGRALVTAGQVHGREVRVVREARAIEYAGCDALVTLRRDVVLGIAVADCCPVWLVADAARGLALVHAGRRGMELAIVPAAVDVLCRETGVPAGCVRAFLGPCIRPPHYEVDVAAGIKDQLAVAGVRQVADCGLDTATDPARFYSYRIEKGRTGRMMALGALPEQAAGG